MCDAGFESEGAPELSADVGEQTVLFTADTGYARIFLDVTQGGTTLSFPPNGDSRKTQGTYSWTFDVGRLAGFEPGQLVELAIEATSKKKGPVATCEVMLVE